MNSLNESEKSNSKEFVQNLPKYETPDKQSKHTIELHRVQASHIDEGAWAVCDKVWQLIEKPIIESNESLLNERLADMQVNK